MLEGALSLTIFENNRTAIRKQSPELVRKLDRVPERRQGIKLFPSRKGPVTCQVLSRKGRWVTLHSTVNPQDESMRIVERLGVAKEGIPVLVGIGLGYPLLALMNSTDLEGHTVVLVEQDLYLFKKAMELFDWTPLFQKADLHLLIDEEIEQILNTITKIRMKGGFQNLILIPHGPSLRRDPDFYGPLLDQLRLIEASSFRGRSNLRPFIRDHLNVLVLDSSYFLIKECIKALEGLGHRVLRVPVCDDRLVETILRHVAQDRPDFLLAVNHLGFDEEGKLTELLGDLNLPFVIWYVDSPTFIIRNFRENVSPNCMLFIWERTYLKRMKAYGFRKSFFLPLATDPSVFRPIRRRHVPMHFRGSVSFVGNSMVETVEDWFSRFPNSRAVQEISRLAVPLQMENHHLMIDQILEAIADENGLRAKFKDPVHHLDFQAALVWKATLEYRKNLIESLESFEIRVFGDRGWNEILNGSAKILPPVSYYDELPLIFNGSDVNLNATSFQMNSAVNQRVFDAAACGAFLITDHQADMDAFFDRDSEAVCYEDALQAREQVAYYLNHPKDRREIARKARQRVLNEHTYAHRLETILRLLKAEFGSF